MRNIFKNRFSQLKKNVFSGSVFQFFNIGIIFLAYPVYIQYLGFELFSVWTLLTALITLGKMGNLGISDAIITFTAKASAKKDITEIRSIFYNSIYIILLPSIAICLILFFGSGYIVRFLGVPAEYGSESVFVLPYIGLAVFLFLTIDVFFGIIKGIGRLDLASFLLLILNMLKVGISILLLTISASLTSMVWAVIAATVIMIVAGVIILNYSFSLDLLRIKPVSRKVMSRLLKFGLNIIGMQVSSLLTIPFIKIVLSRVTGVEAVGVFELAEKAGYGIRSVFNQGLLALLPEISYLSGDKKRNKHSNEKIYSLTIKYSKYLVYICIPLFLVLAVSAPFWLRLWLGESYRPEIFHGFVLLVPGVLASLLILPAFYSLLATNYERFCLFESIIRAGLTILFFTLFYLYTLQLEYAFILLSFTLIISNLYLFIIFMRKFGQKRNHRKPVKQV